jgi:outer membrane protein W
LGGGLDWWLSKSWGINLEAKQYFMETEVDRSQFTLDNSITKVEINPLIMSAGIAYRF